MNDKIKKQTKCNIFLKKGKIYKSEIVCGLKE